MQNVIVVLRFRQKPAKTFGFSGFDNRYPIGILRSVRGLHTFCPSPIPHLTP